MFLKNCWYVAGWGSDIDDGPLARTSLCKPDHGRHLRVFYALTSKTENSIFYFFGHAPDFALGDDAVSTTMFDMVS